MMETLRKLIEQLDQEGNLEKVTQQISTKYEAPYILKEYDGRKAVFFSNVKGYDIPIVGNLCCRRDFIAKGLNVSTDKLADRILYGIRNPIKPKIVEDGPSQEKIEGEVNLHKLPVLMHYEYDKAPYITSGIVIAKDPETDRLNASYHRMMVIGKNRLVARLVEGRDLHRFYIAAKKKKMTLEVAVVIGAPPALLVAASTSPGQLNEIDVAGGLLNTPLEMVKCKSVDLIAPRYAEIVLEGRLTLENAPEGPFVDITGAYDIIRDQPILEVNLVTHRIDAIYQALLPGGYEHLLLMGLPKEAKILEATRSVGKVLDAALTLAGSNWLDAAILIKKTHPHEPFLIGLAAISAHPSLKRIVIVDEDVNVRDLLSIEKAVIERAHPVNDYLVINHIKGSSLDKSILRGKGETELTPAKVIIDATIKGDKMYYELGKIPRPKSQE